MHRDLPYKRGLEWRRRSFLLEEGQEELLAHWREVFENAQDWSIWLLTFNFGDSGYGPQITYEPIQRQCGQWRSLGPGRRYTDEEILEADDLAGIELMRERWTNV